ncbi:MAG: DAK2 domain-containing protein [Blautia sp.]|nr:DAK2 domain-containing protein [Blautia sp.]
MINVFQKAFQGAFQGMEDSKSFRSQKGRSRNFREKTVGLPDPGAVSTSLLFQAFYETIKEAE